MRTLLLFALTACGAAASRNDCAGCHVAVATEFATSRHASAAAGRVFQAMRARAGPQQQTFCDTCHAPGRHVVCLDCHGAVGNEAAQNGLLRLSTRIGSARRSRQAPHEVDERPFIASSELCGTCHEVHGPGQFHETPFSEWVDAGATRTCAECHLNGHRFDASLLLRGAVALSFVRGATGTREVELRSRVEGHFFPSGARFVHEAWLEVRVDDGPLQRFDLSDELDSTNPLEATRTTVNALGPREVRRYPVDAVGRVEARVLYRRYRPSVLAWLELADVEAPVVEVARVAE